MDNLKTKLFTFLFFFLAFNTANCQVFPGDANNDGIVNHYDILNIGFAYGHTGPSRAFQSSDAVEAVIPLLWPLTFPDSLNYAFSDANGDGWINFEDLATVSNNYNILHGDSNMVIIPVPGVEGIDPPLSFGPPEITRPLTAGSVIEFPINLGNALIPISSYNGIAFTITYDSEAIGSIQFDFGNGWNTNENTYNFINSQPGTSDIASTNLGRQYQSGFGEIGKLSVVIEADLIDFLKGRVDSANTVIQMKDIMLVDNDFNKIPIVLDSIQLKIYHPKLLTSIKEHWQQQIKIHPTVVSDFLTIHTNIPISAAEIYLVNGQRIKSIQPQEDFESSFDIDCQNLNSGTYILSIHTAKGIMTKRIFIN